MLIDIRKEGEGLICIYKLNFPNGKSYIGQTINLKRRMSEHNYKSNPKQVVDKAIQKHGRIFEVEILEIIEDTSLLNEREQYYIALYNTNDRNKGYNITPCGDVSCWNPKRKLTKEQFLDIRKRFAEGEDFHALRREYEHLIGSGSFNKIINFETYTEIGVEYKGVRTLTREEKIGMRSSSVRSGKATLTVEDVKFIRQKFEKEGYIIKEIWQQWFSHLSPNVVRCVCRGISYKDITLD